MCYLDLELFGPDDEEPDEDVDEAGLTSRMKSPSREVSRRLEICSGVISLSDFVCVNSGFI